MLPPVVAAEGKIPAVILADEQSGNPSVKPPEKDDRTGEHYTQRTPQRSGFVGSFDPVAPELQICTSMEPPSSSQEIRGRLQEADFEAIDNEALLNDPSVTGGEPDRSNRDTSVVQDETIPRNEKVLATEDHSMEHAEVDHYDAKEQEDAASSSSRPISMLGSLSRTIRGLVGGQSTCEGANILDGPQRDSALAEPISEPREVSTTESHMKDQSMKDDETQGVPQNPESVGTGVPDIFEDVETPSLGPNWQSEPILGPKSPETADSDDCATSGSPTMTNNDRGHVREATSHGTPVSEQLDDDDRGSTTEAYPDGPSSVSSDDHFSMTGHEAIPGTMTHGSDTSGSEIIEPIPGTMTHGVDYISTDAKGSSEDPTPTVEKGVFEVMSTLTEAKQTLDLGTGEGPKVIEDFKVPEDNAVSPCHASAEWNDEANIEGPMRTIEHPTGSLISMTTNKQAVLDDSQINHSQLEAVLKYGIPFEQNTSSSTPASSIVEGILSAEELPTLHGATSESSMPIEGIEPHTQELHLDMSEESRQLSPGDGQQTRHNSLGPHKAEPDVDGDISWSEHNSQDASYSKDESIEAHSAADTSIDSVLPTSTGTTSRTNDNTYLSNVTGRFGEDKGPASNIEHTSHAAGVDMTEPPETEMATDNSFTNEIGPAGESENSCLDDVKVEIPGQDADDSQKSDNLESMHPVDVKMSQGNPALLVRDEPLHHAGDISGGDEHSPGYPGPPTTEDGSETWQESEATDLGRDSSHGHDDPSFQGDRLQPFSNDGDTVDQYEHRKENDGQVRLSTGHDPSAAYLPQMHDKDDGSGLVPEEDRHPDADSQPFMTPLASADFHTPMQFQDWPTNGLSDYGPSKNFDSQYRPDDQLSATVHGQEDLFEDDNQSEDELAEYTEDDLTLESSEHISVQDHVTSPVRCPSAEIDLEDESDEEAGAIPAGGGVDAESLQHGYQLNEQLRGGENGAILDDETTIEAIPTDVDDKVVLRLQPENRPVTPETINLAPRSDVTPKASRGLADSRHNPARPQTPDKQIHRPLGTEDIGTDPFTPVDVTNVPWYARRDSTPRSLHSQSTLSSAPSSPIHSSLPVDNHEPVIRDSWPTPTHDRLLLNGMGRPRNDSQLSSNGDFDPFRYDTKAIAAQWQQRGTAGPHEEGSDVPTKPHRNSIASSSPGGLFQKMRSIFEPTGGPGANRSLPPSPGRNSPVWTRAATAVPHSTTMKAGGMPPSPTRHAAGTVTRDGDGYDSASDRRGGGFLAEDDADDDTDERSSLLLSGYEGVAVN